MYAIVYHRYYLHRDVTGERVRDRNLFISSVAPFPEEESENFFYYQFQFLSSLLSIRNAPTNDPKILRSHRPFRSIHFWKEN